MNKPLTPDEIAELRLIITSDSPMMRALDELEQLREQISKSQDAIAATPALKEWGRCKVEFFWGIIYMTTAASTGGFERP